MTENELIAHWNTARKHIIASQLATWLFPQPRGGGLVQVSYPFVLKSFEAPDPPPPPPVPGGRILDI